MKPPAPKKTTAPAAVYTLADNTPIIMVSIKGARIRVTPMSYGEGKLIKPFAAGWRNQMFQPDNCSYKPTE